MAGAASSEEETISGINVTPLVDVVLVLLIIFLVTAPVIYQSAIKVELPKAMTGEVSQKNVPLNFTISKDGTLHWGKDQLTWEELGRRLAALGSGVAMQTAVISADEAVPHGVVIRLMDVLRQAGLVHFAMAVETPPQK
jgi:biopolymer transport protein TolR